MGLFDLFGSSKKKIGWDLAYFSINLCEGESIQNIVHDLELTSIETNRFIFGLLIVNSVIATWVANLVIKDSISLKKILDEMISYHLAFFEKNSKIVYVGNYVVCKKELDYICKQYKIYGSTEIKTDLSTLFKVVFPYRQEQYLATQPEVSMRFASFAQGKTIGYGPMSPLARQFGTHLTGIEGRKLNGNILVRPLADIFLSFFNAFFREIKRMA